MTGRERVELVCGSYFAASQEHSTSLHDKYFAMLRDALAADLNALTAAREAAGPVPEWIESAHLSGGQYIALTALLDALDGKGER